MTNLLRACVLLVVLLGAPNDEYECMVPKRIREFAWGGWKVRAAVPREILPLARSRYDIPPEEQRQRRKPAMLDSTGHVIVASQVKRANDAAAAAAALLPACCCLACLQNCQTARRDEAVHVALQGCVCARDCATRGSSQRHNFDFCLSLVSACPTY